MIAPKDQVNDINRAAQGRNLITFDSDCAKCNRFSTSAPTTFEAGKTLGGQIVKMLPNGGKMAVFVGTLSADNAAQRLAGIEDAIKGHNIEIVAKKEDATDRAKARSNVEDVINAYGDLNLVTGLGRTTARRSPRPSKPPARRAKSWPRCSTKSRARWTASRPAPSRCTCVQKPFQFGYLSASGCTTWP